MSLVYDIVKESEKLDQKQTQQHFFKIFEAIMQQKNATKIQNNRYTLKFHQNQDKIQNGITIWSCSERLKQLRIEVSFQLKNTKKLIQVHLADMLTNFYRPLTFFYKRPKITMNGRISTECKSNISNKLESYVVQVMNYLCEVVERLRIIQEYHMKIQQYQQLISMREFFELNRSSRKKSSKISLKQKKIKCITDVKQILGPTLMGFNKLQPQYPKYLMEQKQKYFKYQSQILKAFKQRAKNKEQTTVERSVLTSIDIIKILKQEQKLQLKNRDQESQLSILYKSIYVYKKQLTIHKQSGLQSTSEEIISQLIKKQKTQKGSIPFQNETKLLTHLKGSYHPHIAEYYCILQEFPFQSGYLFLDTYDITLQEARETFTPEKKLKILHQISKVISFLKYRKICHRDLKPSNVMIDKKSDVRVIDWGSACGMFSQIPDESILKVNDQTLYSTVGYYQSYFKEIYFESFGQNYTKEEIQKGQFFDIYSFGVIVWKLFDLDRGGITQWLDTEMQYLSKKCRQKNPCDRLSAYQIEIYLMMVRKKLKKLDKGNLSEQVSSCS